MIPKLILLLITIAKLPLHFIYLLSHFIPRNNKKWVFSSWEGNAYRGSNRYLYEYVSKNETIESIWITKNKQLYDELHDKDLNIKYGYSISGIYTLFTAKVIFVSHGLYDVIPCFTGGALIVCIGHVTFPMKNMSFIDNFSKLNYMEKLKGYLRSPYDHIKPTYEVVASDYAKKAAIFLQVENKNEYDRIMPIGLPKSDFIINYLRKSREEIFEAVSAKNLPNMAVKDKLILFLPTWREDKNFNLFAYGYKSKIFDEILSRNDAFMIVNFHPFDEFVRLNKMSKMGDRICVTSYSSDEVVRLLCATDVFITDYSSLFSDYLLLDRPIIFCKFSHDKYIRERDLQISYEDLPGKIVTNWNDLGVSLKEILSDGRDLFKEERKIWKDLVYPVPNKGSYSNNIVSFLQEILV